LLLFRSGVWGVTVGRMRLLGEFAPTISRESVRGAAWSAILHGALIAALIYSFMPTAKVPGGGRDRATSLAVFDFNPSQDMSTASAPAAAPLPSESLRLSQSPVTRAAQVKNVGLASDKKSAIAASGAAVSAEPANLAVASGGSAVGPQSASASAAINSAYPRALLDHVRPYFRYPDTDGARPQGPPRVGFALNRAGQIIRVWLVDTSGSALLDRAVIDAIERSNPMPPIPPGLPDQISVVVPVDFSLSGVVIGSPSDGRAR
jgi:TonB family protein